MKIKLIFLLLMVGMFLTGCGDSADDPFGLETFTIGVSTSGCPTTYIYIDGLYCDTLLSGSGYRLDIVDCEQGMHRIEGKASKGGAVLCWCDVHVKDQDEYVTIFCN